MTPAGGVAGDDNICSFSTPSKVGLKDKTSGVVDWRGEGMRGNAIPPNILLGYGVSHILSGQGGTVIQ